MKYLRFVFLLLLLMNGSAAATVSVYHGSLSVPTGGTITDVNQSTGCAQYNASHLLSSDSDASGCVPHTVVPSYTYFIKGCTDSSSDDALVSAALASVYSTGGTVVVEGLCYYDQAIVPTTTAVTGGYTQQAIRITGEGGPAWSGTWFTDLANGLGGLDLRYSGSAYPAKIDLLGSGYFELDHLVVRDDATDHYPFLFSSNATVYEHNNTFIGDTSQVCSSGSSPTNCPQQDLNLWGSGGLWASDVSISSGSNSLTIGSDDPPFTSAMVGWNVAFGGATDFYTTGLQGCSISTFVSSTEVTLSCNSTENISAGIANYYPPPGTLSIYAPFQGYGSRVVNNLFMHLRRVGVWGNYANGVVYEDNTFSQNMGCAHTDITDCAPYYFGTGSTLVYGNTVRGDTVEMDGYPYTFYLGFAQGNYLAPLIGDEGDQYAGVVYAAYIDYSFTNTLNLVSAGVYNVADLAGPAAGLQAELTPSGPNYTSQPYFPWGAVLGNNVVGQRGTPTTINGPLVLPGEGSWGTITDGGTVGQNCGNPCYIALGTAGTAYDHVFEFGNSSNATFFGSGDTINGSGTLCWEVGNISGSMFEGADCNGNVYIENALYAPSIFTGTAGSDKNDQVQLSCSVGSFGCELGTSSSDNQSGITCRQFEISAPGAGYPFCFDQHGNEGANGDFVGNANATAPSPAPTGYYGEAVIAQATTAPTAQPGNISITGTLAASNCCMPQIVQPSPTVFPSPVPTATPFASITATTGTSYGSAGAWGMQVVVSTIANGGTTAGDYYTVCAYASPTPTAHYGLVEANCPSAPSGYTLISQATAFSPTTSLGDNYETLGLNGFARYANNTSVTVELEAACSCATSASMGPGVFSILLYGI